MIHAVKATPQYFADIISSKKTFEVRKNDRDYKENDYIALNEYALRKGSPENNRYTGRSVLFRISYVLDNPEYCKEGYVVLGIIPCYVNLNDENGLKTVRVLYGRVSSKTQRHVNPFANSVCRL